MASVFLSYVRDDAGKAQTLAAFLERAGHSVWWDRRIKGGAQYSAEIETALNAAEKVVVLWSAKAVASAWVRDEAAAGRDTGRLVPVTLDSSQPPLGFRQFQTIDLSRWHGHSPPSNLQDLLDAVGDETSASQPEVKAQPQRRSFNLAVSRRAAIPAAAIAIIIAAGGWWWSGRSEAHTPVVAIDAASDSAESREAARQLAVHLGDVAPTQAPNFELITGSGNADLRLRIDASETGASANRDLTVLAGSNGSILWSTSLRQPAAAADQLPQQLTMVGSRVLNCALEALSDRRDRIDASLLKAYVNSCLRLEGLYGTSQYNPEVIDSFEQVVAKAPHFTGAWRKLLAAESEIAIAPDPPPVLVANLRRHIADAAKYAPGIGEILLAKASLLPPSDFLGRFDLYRQAVKSDADNPFVYRIMSERLLGVGRMMDSVGFAGGALELDPLSPAVQDNYISSLAYAGQVDAAYAQLRKSEAMWPSAQNIRFARYRLDLRYGDPREAMALYESEQAGSGSMAQVLFLEARMDPSPANIQRAVDASRTIYLQEPREIQGLMQVLGQFGRKDEAIDELLHYKRPDAIGYNSEVFFRPAMREIWRDPRSIAAAAHAGLLAFWVKSGRWPDFCSDPTLPYDCRKEAAKYRV